MSKLLKLLLVLGLCVPTLPTMKANEHNEQFVHQAQDIDYQAPAPTKPKVPFSQASTLPSSYDARALGYVTAMENQGEFGTCWSYGVISSAETSLLKQGYLKDAKEVDFSELQVAYGYYHRNVDDLYLTPVDTAKSGVSGNEGYLQAGGNTIMSAMYLSQWQSIMSEADFPNVNQFDQLLDSYASLNKTQNVDYVMKEAIFLPKDDIKAIKEALIQYGSVVASYYSESEYHPYIYNTTTNRTNHVITLVGYDDNISREMFANSNASGTLPQRDGAWIMRNSWGTGYGDQGYFYVSYDQYLDSVAAFTYMPKENQNIYYYDGGSQIADANYANTSTLQYANVFETAYSDAYTQEVLHAVNVGIASASTSYEIQLYRLNANPNSPVDGTALLQEPVKGNVTYAGLYTIPLKEAIALQTGDAISVVVTLKANDGSPKIYTSSSTNAGFVNITESNEPGQSYYYDKDGWIDCMNAYDACARIKLITKTTSTQVNGELNYYTQILNQYGNQNAWLPSSVIAEINTVLNNKDIHGIKQMLSRLDKMIFDYQLLVQIANDDVLEMKEWLNSKEAKEVNSSQINQLQQKLNNLENALKTSNVAYDDLAKATQELQDIYKEIIYGLYIQHGPYSMLSMLCDELDMFQYGEYARYLTFSQLNELYMIGSNARNVLQTTAQDYELMAQCSIVNEALNHYQALAKQNYKSSDLLKTKLNEFKQLDVNDNYTAPLMRRIQKATAITQRAYACDVYAAQVVRLQVLLRQAQMEGQALPSVDKDGLKAKMEDYAYVLTNSNKFTNDSFVAFKNVYAEAEAIMKDEKVTQEQVDAIKVSLESAYKGLKEKDMTPPLDPSYFNQKAATQTSVTFEWTPSTSDDVAYYELVSLPSYQVIKQVTTTTYVLEGLTPGSSGKVMLYVYDNDGNRSYGIQSAYATLPALKAPNKVENVIATDTNYKTITLTWDASETATAYDVYRKAYDSDEFKLYKTVEDTTVAITGVMTGKEYAFYVVAKNEAGAAEASATVTKATTLHGKVTLDIDQISTSTFKLGWNKIDGATRYIVYRKRNDDKMKKVLTLGADKLEYVTAEMPNGDFQFILKAGRYDSSNRVMTDSSNTVAVSVEKVAPAVTLKAATKSIKVSWSKMEGVTHYQVYRATSKDGKYTKLITTTDTSYTAKSLSSGKKYFFKVRGYKQYKSGTDIKYNVYTPYSTIVSAVAK